MARKGGRRDLRPVHRSPSFSSNSPVLFSTSPSSSSRKIPGPTWEWKERRQSPGKYLCCYSPIWFSSRFLSYRRRCFSSCSVGGPRQRFFRGLEKFHILWISVVWISLWYSSNSGFEHQLSPQSLPLCPETPESQAAPWSVTLPLLSRHAGVFRNSEAESPGPRSRCGFDWRGENAGGKNPPTCLSRGRRERRSAKATDSSPVLLSHQWTSAKWRVKIRVCRLAGISPTRVQSFCLLIHPSVGMQRKWLGTYNLPQHWSPQFGKSDLFGVCGSEPEVLKMRDIEPHFAFQLIQVYSMSVQSSFTKARWWSTANYQAKTVVRLPLELGRGGLLNIPASNIKKNADDEVRKGADEVLIRRADGWRSGKISELPNHAESPRMISVMVPILAYCITFCDGA